jgi:hypothetical protein
MSLTYDGKDHMLFISLKTLHTHANFCSKILFIKKMLFAINNYLKMRKLILSYRFHDFCHHYNNGLSCIYISEFYYSKLESMLMILCTQSHAIINYFNVSCCDSAELRNDLDKKRHKYNEEKADCNQNVHGQSLSNQWQSV